MSPIGKVPVVHQPQVDINQMQAEAHALREDKLRQTTVTATPEGDRLRMREDREKRREKRHRKKQDPLDGQDLADKETVDVDPGRKRIDITV